MLNRKKIAHVSLTRIQTLRVSSADYLASQSGDFKAVFKYDMTCYAHSSLHIFIILLHIDAGCLQNVGDEAISGF